jgi:hypothetical protein
VRVTSKTYHAECPYVARHCMRAGPFENLRSLQIPHQPDSSDASRWFTVHRGVNFVDVVVCVN